MCFCAVRPVRPGRRPAGPVCPVLLGPSRSSLRSSLVCRVLSVSAVCLGVSSVLFCPSRPPPVRSSRSVLQRRTRSIDATSTCSARPLFHLLVSFVTPAVFLLKRSYYEVTTEVLPPRYSHPRTSQISWFTRNVFLLKRSYYGGTPTHDTS